MNQNGEPYDGNPEEIFAETVVWNVPMQYDNDQTFYQKIAQ